MSQVFVLKHDISYVRPLATQVFFAKSQLQSHVHLKQHFLGGKNIFAFMCYFNQSIWGRNETEVYSNLITTIAPAVKKEVFRFVFPMFIPNHSLSLFLQEVQKQASLFSLYSNLVSTLPSLAVTLLIVAYSDRAGRKITVILPLTGTLIYTLSFLAVSYFELNIYLLIGSSFLSSLFGGLSTFLGGCFAYIADLCDDGHQKTLRMAGLDMMIGLLAGVASISTGYFVRAAGFNWPFITSALCQCLVLLYAIFILEETVKKVPDDAGALNGTPQSSALKHMISGIYQMFAKASSRSRIILILLMTIFTSFSFTYVGGISPMMLYELNKPLCWTEILIGYGSALSTTVFLTSFVGVSLFTYCGVPQLVIVLMGIMSVMSGMLLLAFTKTTFLMFVGGENSSLILSV